MNASSAVGTVAFLVSALTAAVAAAVAHRRYWAHLAAIAPYIVVVAWLCYRDDTGWALLIAVTTFSVIYGIGERWRQAPRSPTIKQTDDDAE